MTVPLDRANNNLGGGQAGEELDLLRLYPRAVKSVMHHPAHFLWGINEVTHIQGICTNDSTAHCYSYLREHRRLDRRAIRHRLVRVDRFARRLFAGRGRASPLTAIDTGHSQSFLPGYQCSMAPTLPPKCWRISASTFMRRRWSHFDTPVRCVLCIDYSIDNK